MTTQNRVYLVESEDTNEVHLIEAPNAAQAIRHVVRKRYSANPATVKDVAELCGAGMKIVQANDKDKPANA